MIKTIVIPQNNTLQLSIPSSYIGKEIEVLVYAKDELVEESADKVNVSHFKGLLNSEEADKFHFHIAQARTEWNRDI